MERPERPTRHRSHESKWKRIIEPVRDSDSSDMSADSDTRPFQRRYIRLDAPGTSSSTSQLRRSQSPENNHDELGSLLRSLETYSLVLDPLVVSAPKKTGEDEPTAGPSIDSDEGPSNNYHLLHHDYAERNGTSGRDNFLRESIYEMPHARKRMRMNSDHNLLNELEGENTGVPELNLDDMPWMVERSRAAIPAVDPTSATATGTSQADTEPTNLALDYTQSEGNTAPSIGGTSTANTSTDAVISTSHHLRPFPMEYSVCSLPSIATTTVATATSQTLTSTQEHLGWYAAHFSHRFNRILNWSHSGQDIQYVRGNSAPSTSTRGAVVMDDNDNDGDREGENRTAGNSQDTGPEVEFISCMGPSTSQAARLKKRAKAVDVVRLNDDDDDNEEIIIVDDQSPPPRSSEPLQLTTDAARAVSDVAVNLKKEASDKESTEKTVAVQTRDSAESGVATQTVSSEVQEPSPVAVPAALPLRLREDETLNQGLISLLECPVCMEYMAPPIHQCRRGHLVCSACKPKLPSCPTCRSRFTDQRNLAMEKVADKLNYPCKNAHMGCPESLRLTDKRDHESNCAFRTYRCIENPCDWKGLRCDILKHMATKHKQSVKYGTEQVIPLHVSEQSDQNWIVSALGELFRINFICLHWSQRIQVVGSVQYIGPCRNAPCFQYSMEVSERGGAHRRVTYSRTTHRDESSTHYADYGDAFLVRCDSTKYFCEGPSNDKVMYVRVQVNKCN